MTTPQITIHDVANGETITRDMTAAELASYETTKAVNDAIDKAQADAKAANDTKVASAKSKLKALGLTDAEITALLG
jgi:hypothetical protein